MLILLPPSEGKSAPARGPRLRMRALSFRDLDRTRGEVLDSLVALCAKPAAARRALGLGPTQEEEIARDAALRTAPCAPAIEVYDGVLYEALDAGSLTAAQRARLHEDVAIASALWGLVRPLDPIPAYRLSGDVRLPGIGRLAAAWKEPVTSALAGGSPGPVIDLRSGAYRFGDLPGGSVVGRVLLERDGRRSVVSHHNKATKGRAVRALASSRKRPRTLDDAIAVLEAAGIRCELTAGSAGKPGQLDLVTREL